MPKLDEDYFKIDDNTAIKKNAVEDVLTEGESVLLRLVPDKKDFIMESIFKGLLFALLWGGVDAFIIFLMFQPGGIIAEGGFTWILIPFFALHLLPVWLYIANVIRRVGGYRNIEYVFTDKRIIIRSGLVGIDFKFFYYSEIESATVKVGLWDRMFKVGDIILKSAGQTAMLEDIHNPYAYGAKIQELTQDIKADIQYPNDLRPDENHGYNTKYKK